MLHTVLTRAPVPDGRRDRRADPACPAPPPPGDRPSLSPDDPSLADVSPALRNAFISGSAPVHEAGRARLPQEFAQAPNGHEGSHHFLMDDFVTAVNEGTLPSVNAWAAARYTLPGVIAHESMRRGGERLRVPDFGGAVG